MFTNEFEFDESKTVVMDETDELDDVELMIGDNYVWIRQWNEEDQRYDVVQMSPHMFGEMLEAMKQPEGMYTMKYRMTAKPA
jgi:hypothetical protein